VQNELSTKLWAIFRRAASTHGNSGKMRSSGVLSQLYRIGSRDVGLVRGYSGQDEPGRTVTVGSMGYIGPCGVVNPRGLVDW
jgi:hypothetical protein